MRWSLVQGIEIPERFVLKTSFPARDLDEMDRNWDLAWKRTRSSGKKNVETSWILHVASESTVRPKLSNVNNGKQYQTMILILACSLRYSKPPKLWFLQPGLTVSQCVIYIYIYITQFSKSRKMMKCVQEQNRRRMKTWHQTTGEELTAFWTRFNWVGSEYHEILPWEYHKNTPKLDGYTMLYPNWPSCFFFSRSLPRHRGWIEVEWNQYPSCGHWGNGEHWSMLIHVYHVWTILYHLFKSCQWRLGWKQLGDSDRVYRVCYDLLLPQIASGWLRAARIARMAMVNPWRSQVSSTNHPLESHLATRFGCNED